MLAKHVRLLRSLIGVALSQGDELFSSSRLPQLPANAQYVLHENRCFDWGTVGWAVTEGKVATARYSYVIIMNSSVRGPFLPAYWPVRARRAWCLHMRLSVEPYSDWCRHGMRTCCNTSRGAAKPPWQHGGCMSLLLFCGASHPA